MTTCEAEVFRRADGLFDWRLYAENGEQMCESSQGYTEPNDAWEGFGRVVAAVQMTDDPVGVLRGAMEAIRAHRRGEPDRIGGVVLRRGVADG